MWSPTLYDGDALSIAVNNDRPRVSIILPCFNRGRFLQAAVQSIRQQSFDDWELVVVDDGSTDGSGDILMPLLEPLGRRARYIRQANAGPYGARNTGLDLANGEYIAFFDSDDVWLPDYLSTCVAAAAANPDVHWVYTACRVIDLSSRRELQPSTFYDDGQPKPFLRLRSERRGELHVIDDPGALKCLTATGFFCGLQASLIRRDVFEGYRFKTALRNEGEDVLTAVRMLSAGRRFGYIDRALVLYHVHTENSSAAATTISLEKRLFVGQAYAAGYKELASELAGHAVASSHVRYAAARAYFWQLGYAVQWQNGLRQEALASYRQALRLWPWSLRFWKTYLAATLRTRVRR